MPRQPEKSGGAFRTIREVADWLGVPTHVLRFWESKFEQIAPVKGAGGRRYYRPEDMRLLGGIKVMLHDDGLTIRAVARKIEETGVDSIMSMSPELDGGEAAPAPRTRRVIRKGDDGAKPKEAAPPEDDETEVPADPAPDEAPAEVPGPPPVAIAKEGASPLAETIPDQPDAPELAVEAPDPGDPLPEAPAPKPSETPLNRTAPDKPRRELDSAPADPPHQVRHAPEPDETPPPETPEPPPPEDLPADLSPPAPVDPLTRARALARDAGPLDPQGRKRLRRIVRRYRALAEEIADDLADTGADGGTGGGAT